MLQAFIYPTCAVTTRHWFEIDLDTGRFEHGARLELRRRTVLPHTGTESATQTATLTEPWWRIDLFDRLESEPGSYSAAHCHPDFSGPEPCPRVWEPLRGKEPWAWASEQLLDVTQLAVEDIRTTIGDDVAQIAADSDLIVQAAQRYAPEKCRSRDQCAAMTVDVAPAVRLMIANMSAGVDVVDPDYVTPWLS